MRGLNNEKRYALLDSLRGLLLLEMIVYHFFWDLVYLFEQDLPWFHSSLCYWWQQSICWRFIFLSGFCWPLGKRAVRRAVQVFGGSVLVMVITHIFVPDQAVTFGVLFFLGSGMLLLKLLDRAAVQAGSCLGHYSKWYVIFSDPQYQRRLFRF